MANALTVKGQVTIPKRIREALGLKPGDGVDFDVNERGEVLLRRAGKTASGAPAPDRFERAVGTAEVRWRTDELMALLRDPE